MSEENNKDVEIEEIFSHIRKMMKNDSSEQKEEEKTVEVTEEEKPDNEKIVVEENIISVDKEPVIESIVTDEPVAQDIPEETISTVMSSWEKNGSLFGICDLCKKEIELESNLSGLIVDETFFACESCCSNTPKEKLISWTNTKMTSKNNLRPIGLWLVDKQNKDISTFIKR